MEDLYTPSVKEKTHQKRDYVTLVNRSGEHKFVTHNHVDHIDNMGTSLAGEIECSFYRILEVFGRPEDGDEYKIDAHWSIEWEDGKVATIYNWKNGLNYNYKIIRGSDHYGIQLTDIREWHIGGHDSEVVSRVEGMLGIKV